MEYLQRLRSLNWNSLAFIFLGGLVLVALTTFLDYGLTWDEELCHLNGYLTLKWYRSLLHLSPDTSVFQVLDLYLYGSFYDTFAHLFSRVFPLGTYDSMHLLNVLVGIFGILGAYRIATHLASPMAGCLCILLLTLTPHFYGHMFSNPKDIPFATFYTWALYYMILTYENLPNPPRPLLIKLGLFMGMTLGIRIGGILLFLYLGALFSLWVIQQKIDGKNFVRQGWQGCRALILSVSIAWLVMLLFWPYAQISPLLNPIRAITENAHFNFNPEVLFQGKYIGAKSLPWNYLPVWFSIRLPEFYFLALATAMALLLWKQKRTHLFTSKSTPYLCLILAAFTPILVAILLGSTLYDGKRHFLFTIPPLAILAALSLYQFLQLVGTKTKIATGVALSLSLSLTLYDMIRLHPYQSVYFNRTVAGGTLKASNTYDFDYWGSSVKEGMEWLIEHHMSPHSRPLRVSTCANLSQLRNVLNKTKDPRFEIIENYKPHDIFIAIKRMDCHKKVQGELIHTISRMDAPLLYIYKKDRHS